MIRAEEDKCFPSLLDVVYGFSLENRKVVVPIIIPRTKTATKKEKKTIAEVMMIFKKGRMGCPGNRSCEENNENKEYMKQRRI